MNDPWLCALISELQSGALLYVTAGNWSGSLLYSIDINLSYLFFVTPFLSLHPNIIFKLKFSSCIAINDFKAKGVCFGIHYHNSCIKSCIFRRFTVLNALLSQKFLSPRQSAPDACVWPLNLSAHFCDLRSLDNKSVMACVGGAGKPTNLGHWRKIYHLWRNAVIQKSGLNVFFFIFESLAFNTYGN